MAESEAVLDPSGDFLLKWRVDYSNKKIRFTVKLSKDAPHLRWFSLGFSDRGNLDNSDVCIMWVDYKGGQHVTVSIDLYIPSRLSPKENSLSTLLTNLFSSIFSLSLVSSYI